VVEIDPASWHESSFQLPQLSRGRSHLKGQF
jgi:hypothetical protein